MIIGLQYSLSCTDRFTGSLTSFDFATIRRAAGKATARPQRDATLENVSESVLNRFLL